MGRDLEGQLLTFLSDVGNGPIGAGMSQPTEMRMIKITRRQVPGVPTVEAEPPTILMSEGISKGEAAVDAAGRLTIIIAGPVEGMADRDLDVAAEMPELIGPPDGSREADQSEEVELVRLTVPRILLLLLIPLLVLFHIRKIRKEKRA